jgi:hypothetical protein
MSAKETFVICLVIIQVIAGCAAKTVPEKLPDLNFISFVQDGLTTKKDVLLRLGPASGAYQHETILTYRIFYDPSDGNKWRVIDKCLPFDWQFVTYNLVLVFNENSILESHSLIQLRKK